MSELSPAVADYLHFWSELSSDRSEWVHPQDREIVAKRTDLQTHDFKSFLASAHMGSSERNIVHGGLLPIPHVGDLRSAKVVVLYANPGFDVMDYWAEYERPEFRRRAYDSLLGIVDRDFPFHFLDPSLCWTGGFRWWRSRFGGILHHYANTSFAEASAPYWSAFKYLSARITALEAFPYHSVRQVPAAMIRKLPSFRAVRALIEKYAEHKVPIILARSHDLWALEKSEHVYVCPRHRTQSFAPNSEAGRFLTRALSAH